MGSRRAAARRARCAPLRTTAHLAAALGLGRLPLRSRRPAPRVLGERGRVSAPASGGTRPDSHTAFGDQGRCPGPGALRDAPGDLRTARPTAARPAGLTQGRYAASGKPLPEPNGPSRDEPALRGDHLRPNPSQVDRGCSLASALSSSSGVFSDDVSCPSTEMTISAAPTHIRTDTHTMSKASAP